MGIVGAEWGGFMRDVDRCGTGDSASERELRAVIFNETAPARAEYEAVCAAARKVFDSATVEQSQRKADAIREAWQSMPPRGKWSQWAAAQTVVDHKFEQEVAVATSIFQQVERAAREKRDAAVRGIEARIIEERRDKRPYWER